ncbi:hypothetical protein [Pseudonocardia kunmingensis]|uniref:Uncharacterized protein n=1 Tax=Pseudonocardia kunmingensis TaxID=630975 RepID=A0A543D3M6_9PSEU|nr:hypothetical protein [Pseudonocardia kunmingensis]TQM03940.1 hypothetical protein FB558_6965 [Pseudonocardia kunmingensis]
MTSTDRGGGRPAEPTRARPAGADGVLGPQAAPRDARGQPVRPRPSQHARPDARPEQARPETGRAQHARPDPARPGPGRPESSRPQPPGAQPPGGQPPRAQSPRPPAGGPPRAVAEATTALATVGGDAGGRTTALPVQRPRPGPPPAPPAPQDVGIYRWLSPVLALLAVALLPLAAATTDLGSLDGWGLAKVLGPAAWASMACAVAACVAELWSPRPRIPMLGTATGVLILCSYGLPSVVEPAARFSTAWLISGFVDAVAGDGQVVEGYDARFYWPAFFAQWAFFRDAAGATQLDEVLRWFPPLIVAVWAIGIYALARSMLGGHRAPWAAAWLFLGLNWIEQDYFSPQATGVVLMLTVLTFALGPLATRRTDAAGVPGWPKPHADAKRLILPRRWLVSAMTPPNRPTLPPRQLLLIYFCSALCLIALAPSHQLTPFAIIGQLAVLAVVGRFRGRGLVLIGIIAVVVYILIAGRDFWVNQLSMITGGDAEAGALESGVADRLAGDTGQVAVKLLRIIVPGLTWLLALVGAWVYWRRRRDLAPIALAAVPMGFAAQGYGGEVFLRIVLFGLPILAILGADALRAVVRWKRGMEYVLAAGMVLLFGSLVLIRGGNESYMIVYPDEVAMAREVYATTPPGLEVVPLVSGVGPYAVDGIDTHSRGNNVEDCSDLIDDPLRCVDLQDPDVIVSFDSTEAYGRDLKEMPPGWSLQVVQQIVATEEYVITYQNGFDVVLRKVEPSNLPGG